MAVVSSHFRGWLSVFALCTHQSHTRTGVHRRELARRRPLATPFCVCGLHAQGSVPDKVVPAKSATQTRAHAHEAVGSLCFGLILLNWKKKKKKGTFSPIYIQHLSMTKWKEPFSSFFWRCSGYSLRFCLTKACCLCSVCGRWWVMPQEMGSCLLVCGWTVGCIVGLMCFLSSSCSDFLNQLHNQNIYMTACFHWTSSRPYI